MQYIHSMKQFRIIVLRNGGGKFQEVLEFAIENLGNIDTIQIHNHDTFGNSSSSFFRCFGQNDVNDPFIQTGVVILDLLVCILGQEFFDFAF